MVKKNIQALQASSYLSGNNAAYVEDLYEDFLQNPSALEPHWRHYFEELQKTAEQEVSHEAVRDQFIQLAKQPRLAAISSTDAVLERKQSQVTQLIDAYRAYGHYQATLDPLGLLQLPNLPELDPSYYGLTPDDLSAVFNAENFDGFQQATLHDIHAALKRIYCGNIGFEYTHITDIKQVRWLQQRIEGTHTPLSPEQKKNLLQQLTAAEGLEKYLGSKYVGQKRFSLEGTDSLIPLLNSLIQRAAGQKANDIVIGMAHRGRLNVLVNVLGKAPSILFEEFEGKRKDHLRSGDVKYHMGFSSDVQTSQGRIHLSLAFNPSHLEIIAPVVEGSVRARQENRGESKEQVIPVILHGDAAFAGQGVVTETFNCSQTRGYSTGGTVHIIVNNQIGFTTSNPEDARSTPYCTDVAKMVQSPIIHVNADDPEAVLFVIQLAFDFRMQFNKDVVIDLVGYRRHGHNEADEPAATQPIMYNAIKQKPTVRAHYADQLIAEGVITTADADAMVADYRNKLDTGQDVVAEATPGNGGQYAFDWTPYLDKEWTASADTRISLKQLQTLAKALETLPEGMTLQPQVARMMDERCQMTEGKLPLNWGYAETLAYASLVTTGYPIRISGQDSGRGTFAHRHAVLFDYKKGSSYTPLQHISPKQAAFRVIDSLLSEEAVLGFEYGYASTNPQSLTIWEAQFGDFANGAQVVIDQFISSGEQKWGRLCGLVMLLPHGYEGMGPEHSSARLERYLQLCAQHNMQVCVPSTPAQIFHLLRRQMIRPFRKPLIVMTPKSLLRHKAAVSSIKDLTDGQFELLIPEIDTTIKTASVKRVILCSGKVYYDLLEERQAKSRNDVALIRIEQLYPFPEDAVTRELKRYSKAQEVVWCQEEPENQGAWYQIQHRIRASLSKGQTLQYAGREASASPAVGSAGLHHEQQKALVQQALT